MHPAHIPLEAEAQSAGMDRAGHHGPRSRLLGICLNAREIPVEGYVEIPQESYGLKVLPAAVNIRYPLPLFSGVVQIEH